MNNSITEHVTQLKNNIENLRSHIEETILRQRIKDETVDTDSIRELLNTYYNDLQSFLARMDRLDRLIALIPNHCCHEIITDYIDIDPDKSMTIKYCNKCSLTFD